MIYRTFDRSGVLSVVKQHSQFATVAGVEHVHAVAVHLVSGLDLVPAMRPDHVVVELDNRVGKLLKRDVVAKVAQGSGPRLGDASTTESKQRQARGSGARYSQRTG